MAERATIAATPREITGKKVSQLRRQGILPANVFGRGLASRAIQVDSRDFMRTVRTAGVRSMFELRVNDEKEPRYVILRGLTRAGGMGEPIHADFYQVDLKRPITTTVNLRIVGEAPAVRDLAGTLIQSLETVAVRCLPLDIPDHIEVDAALLKGFDITITVADLALPQGVEVLTEGAVNIATVNPPRIRLDQAEAPSDEAAAQEVQDASGAEPSA
ncbi:MAG: 50S ribosomal protein L25 [Dehalococcoidia bacterium]|nr:50S ribosomal protein L25 [Dehalococcoidia bacterium]